MGRAWLWTALALAVALAAPPACKKKADEAKGPPAKEKAAPPEPGPRKPAQTSYDQMVDMNGIWKKLQGTWLVGGSFFSSVPAIWDIRGDDITVVASGGSETKTKIELLAPCQLKVGPEYNSFVFDGDTLYAGLGMSGVRAGDTIIACFASGIFVHQGGKCQVHDRFFDQIRTRDAQCEIRKDGTKETFLATDVNRQPKPIYGTEQMDVHGNVLMTGQMRGNKAERVADLAAAKARVAQLRAAKK